MSLPVNASKEEIAAAVERVRESILNRKRYGYGGYGLASSEPQAAEVAPEPEATVDPDAWTPGRKWI